MENELVILNKYMIIENCMKRINSIYDGKLDTLKEIDKQDVILLNLQRACQATIDIAKYIVFARNLEIIQNPKEAFLILKKNDIITAEKEIIMQNMVKFNKENIYNWEHIDLDKLKIFLDNHLDDLREFAREILKTNKGE